MDQDLLKLDAQSIINCENTIKNEIQVQSNFLLKSKSEQILDIKHINHQRLKNRKFKQFSHAMRDIMNDCNKEIISNESKQQTKRKTQKSTHLNFSRIRNFTPIAKQKRYQNSSAIKLNPFPTKKTMHALKISNANNTESKIFELNSKYWIADEIALTSNSISIPMSATTASNISCVRKKTEAEKKACKSQQTRIRKCSKSKERKLKTAGVSIAISKSNKIFDNIMNNDSFMIESRRLISSKSKSMNILFRDLKHKKLSQIITEKNNRCRNRKSKSEAGQSQKIVKNNILESPILKARLKCRTPLVNQRPMEKYTYQNIFRKQDVIKVTVVGCNSLQY